MFSLDGRTALVTGARSGIGAAIAVGLARAGADIVLHGHRDNLDETAAAVEATGRVPERLVLDLSDPDAAGRAATELAARRRVDILVNNAGIIRRGPVLDSTLEDWRSVFAVNIESLYVMTVAIAARMVQRRAGKIISLASMLSFQGGVNIASYAASKHAVAGLTKALANEWGPHNVQVNAIAPGYIATANTEVLLADPDREPQIRQRIPAGRWGTPEDLVGAAVFLASPASDYVNGHILAVDGGWMAR